MQLLAVNAAQPPEAQGPPECGTGVTYTGKRCTSPTPQRRTRGQDGRHTVLHKVRSQLAQRLRQQPKHAQRLPDLSKHGRRRRRVAGLLLGGSAVASGRGGCQHRQAGGRIHPPAGIHAGQQLLLQRLRTRRHRRRRLLAACGAGAQGAGGSAGLELGSHGSAARSCSASKQHGPTWVAPTPAPLLCLLPASPQHTCSTKQGTPLAPHLAPPPRPSAAPLQSRLPPSSCLPHRLHRNRPAAGAAPPPLAPRPRSAPSRAWLAAPPHAAPPAPPAGRWCHPAQPSPPGLPELQGRLQTPPPPPPPQHRGRRPPSGPRRPLPLPPPPPHQRLLLHNAPRLPHKGSAAPAVVASRVQGCGMSTVSIGSQAAARATGGGSSAEQAGMPHLLVPHFTLVQRLLQRR